MTEMEKPEFPEPRIIREGFLPEQDPLMNYRVKKVTKSDGIVWYYPQKKLLWFWIDIGESIGEWYYTEWAAQTLIFAAYCKTQKDKVEYLPADRFKTVRPEPNPPPKNP